MRPTTNRSASRNSSALYESNTLPIIGNITEISLCGRFDSVE
jgi:hypothetical protein